MRSTTHAVASATVPRPSTRRRASLLLVGVLALGAAACGSDDPGTAAGPDQTGTAGLDGDHATTDGDMSGMDMSDGDMSGMDMSGDGHSHEHTTTTEWPDDVALPEIAVTAEPGDGSVALHVELSGFEFADPTENEAVAPRGHVHVLLDGREVGMYFEPDIEIDDVEPGPHTVTVRLSAADHSVWVLDGEPLGASADFEVAGEVAAPDVVIEVAVDDRGVVDGIVEETVSVGDLVEIRVDSAVAEQFHLHTYDVSAELEPGRVAVVRFTADIPGVFEAELEGAGIQVLELTVS